MCRITMLRLESLFVRSNRISMCRITVLRLESLFVRSNRISMCCITVLSLESLFVRSARGGFPCVVLQCCYCVVFPCVVLLVVFVTLYAKKYHVVSLLIEIQALMMHGCERFQTVQYIK